MQPLDYLFQILILVTLSLKGYEFYKKYYRRNRVTLTEDQLIMAFVRSERIRSQKQQNNPRRLR